MVPQSLPSFLSHEQTIYNMLKNKWAQKKEANKRIISEEPMEWDNIPSDGLKKQKTKRKASISMKKDNFQLSSSTVYYTESTWNHDEVDT